MKSSTLALWLFWAVIILVMLIDPYIIATDYGSAYYAITVVSMAALTLNWVLADARQIPVEPSTSLRICVVAVSFVAVPYYLVKYKGFKRSLLSFAKFIGLFLGAVVAVALIETLLGHNA